MKPGLFGISVLCAFATACGNKPQTSGPPPAPGDDGKATAADLEPSELQRRLAEMTPATWVSRSTEAAKLSDAVAGFHGAHPSRRGYIAVDKPLYRPGETIWFRAFDLGTRDLASAADSMATFQLISPKGAAVLVKQVQVRGGNAANDFEIPPEVPGGEYKIQLSTGMGATVSRPVIVSSYQPPQIKKTLKFLRKAYGAGDRVAAALALHRGTGAPLESSDITGVVEVDGAEVARIPLKSDRAGNVVVRFQLPASIAKGNGLLTILVNDGGITESIQKRIPITLKDLAISLYAEGGDLVAGLPGRVYVAAKNNIGKPADFAARVEDDNGTVVARFRSIHDGMGRFELTPDADRTYQVVVEKPTTVETKVAVPAAKKDGCSMQAVDDFKSTRDQVRVAVWCSSARSVVATASLRERSLATAEVKVAASEPTVIALPQAIAGEGAIRVTLFDSALKPLAERLIYRSSARMMVIELKADRESYNPRDKVTLKVKTVGTNGKPIAADLALAVVDDTVLALADDKTANLKARVLLEAEMPQQKIEEPNFYFSDDQLAAVGRDLVLGTHGWRRFEWAPVLNPQPSSTVSATREEVVLDELQQPAPPPPAAPPMIEVPQDVPKNEKARDDRAKGNKAPAKKAFVAAGKIAKPKPDLNADPAPEPVMAQEKAKKIRARGGEGRAAAGADMEMEMDDDWADDKRLNRQVAVAYAPIRQFPAPNYKPDYDGPRTDFRETIYWLPQLRTNAKGEAEVSFHTSDSVTSFRAIAEGTAGGSLGRGEAVVSSKLPVSLAVKMPLEVSSGDIVRLPVTVANESKRRQRATISANFGNAFRTRGKKAPATVDLAPGQRKSFFYELDVVGTGKIGADGQVRLEARAANLADEVEKTIRVVPKGFPQEVSLAGTVAKSNTHELVLPSMLPNTLNAELVMYPSPLATMISGTESMVREPTGCFEQASSANYPNVMVLGYIEEHGNADPLLIAKTQKMLDRGYKKLTGYESPKKGYEWFGGDPGHEALTAYGLLEFVDMTKVYGDVDKAMIARTAAWLKSRRDGKGGYKRNSRALDSFGAAGPEVTNAYITYALALAGEIDIKRELDAAEKVAGRTKDPYVLALTAATLIAAKRDAKGQSAAGRLASLQTKDGSFSGADHSITRSGGIALNIESTALAALAMMASGRSHDAAVRRSIKWLNDNRNGFGGYGSTQSTVLALKAMTTFADHSRQTRSEGVATVKVNGEQVGRIAYEKGHEGELRFPLGQHLRTGKNVIVVELDSKEQLPYSVAVTYSSALPTSSPEAAVALETTLSKTKVQMGEGVTMKVSLKNKKSEGIPMAIARIGLPGGLTFQTWQLKELREKKLILHSIGRDNTNPRKG